MAVKVFQDRDQLSMPNNEVKVTKVCDLFVSYNTFLKIDSYNFKSLVFCTEFLIAIVDTWKPMDGLDQRLCEKSLRTSWHGVQLEINKLKKNYLKL